MPNIIGPNFADKERLLGMVLKDITQEERAAINRARAGDFVKAFKTYFENRWKEFADAVLEFENNPRTAEGLWDWRWVPPENQGMVEKVFVEDALIRWRRNEMAGHPYPMVEPPGDDNLAALRRFADEMIARGGGGGGFPGAGGVGAAQGEMRVDMNAAQVLNLRPRPPRRPAQMEEVEMKPLSSSKVSSSSTVLEVFRNYPKGAHPRAQREGMILSLQPKEFPYDHCFGIEVEIENCKFDSRGPVYKTVCEGWETKQDGSLRNGVEFVTRLGMMGGDCLAYMEALEHLLMDSSKLTVRCGLHIHVDVTGHRMEDLYKLFLVYSVMEPLFFEVSGRRYSNKHCCLVQDSANAITSALNYGHQRDWFKFAASLRKATKYMAMNIYPTSTFGSIEFRQHEGTISVAKVSKWMHILADLCCGVKPIKVESLEETILGLNTTSEYARFIDRMFPNSKNGLLEVEDFHKRMYPGVAYVKECFVSDPEIKV